MLLEYRATVTHPDRQAGGNRDLGRDRKRERQRQRQRETETEREKHRQEGRPHSASDVRA